MGDRPMNKFYGDFMRTAITDNPEVVSAWISKIESIHPMKGFPPVIVGLSYSPKPESVLRLCVGPDCLVYQLINTSEIPETLSHFLITQCYTFVGVEIEVVDLKKLEEDYGINSYDIDAVDLFCVAAKRYGRNDLENASLMQLLRLVLDEENLTTTLDEEVEMLDNLSKARDAILDLEKEIYILSNMTHNQEDKDVKDVNRRLIAAKVECDCISTFVTFGLGEFLKANQF
ncbi:hypothetical protein ACJIZ3_008344 [Penstemon smallii]|uniref:Uncharacterized protein n=1 Tax=Penstemon smallii TaxID=265156 RepID=A0ABD3TB13_9LAMI